MPLAQISAARLIELLASHIAAAGADVPVMISTRSMDHPVVRCWYDEEKKQIAVGAT